MEISKQKQKEILESQIEIMKEERLRIEVLITTLRANVSILNMQIENEKEVDN